jgi:hypothetical protein
VAQVLVENPYGSSKGAAVSLADRKKRSINSMFNLTFTSTIADGEQNFAPAGPVNHIMIAKTRKQSKKKLSPRKAQEQASLSYFETIEQQQKRMKKIRKRRGTKQEDSQNKREQGWDQHFRSQARSPQQS